MNSPFTSIPSSLLTGDHKGNESVYKDNIRHLPSPQRIPFVAKGHDAQLMDAQNARKTVTVNFLSSTDPVMGNIVRRDRYTITLCDHHNGDDTIYFKHGIESIKISSLPYTARTSRSAA